MMHRTILWVVALAVGLSVPLLVHAQADVQAYADTSLDPGHADWSSYATPGACLVAAQSTEKALYGVSFDTARYTPEHDTLSSNSVAVARRCGARFHVETIPADDLLDLVRLSLMSGDDARARSAGERYIAVAPAPGGRSWALLDVANAYLSAHPKRIAAAEAIAARMDALGSSVDSLKDSVHSQLLAVAQRQFSIPDIEREAMAALKAVPGNINMMTTILAAEWYKSSSNAPAETKRLLALARGAQPYDTLVQTFHDFYYGNTHVHPEFGVVRWNGDSAVQTWPVPRKVSILISREILDGAPFMWQRLARQYGSAIAIVYVARAKGFFRDSPPLTAQEEAAHLARYFRDDLQMPLTVAVQDVGFDVLADGRRFPKELPEAQDPMSWGVLLADRTGRVYKLSISGRLEEEAMIDAWVARLIHH